jgi:hypothetical protein
MMMTEEKLKHVLTALLLVVGIIVALGSVTAEADPEPYCVEGCQIQLDDCYAWADPQGTDYQTCERYYADCVASCPQVCEEPQDQYEYATGWVYTGSYNHGTICVSNNAYILWEDFFQRSVYQRTVHCDGTFTDTYLRNETTSAYCKEYIGPGCIGSFYNPPPTC